jgi:hypothetical protein
MINVQLHFLPLQGEHSQIHRVLFLMLIILSQAFLVRELTGGIYFSYPKERTEEVATDTLTYHRHEIEQRNQFHQRFLMVINVQLHFLPLQGEHSQIHRVLLDY